MLQQRRHAVRQGAIGGAMQQSVSARKCIVDNVVEFVVVCVFQQRLERFGVSHYDAQMVQYNLRHVHGETLLLAKNFSSSRDSWNTSSITSSHFGNSFALSVCESMCLEE